MLFDQVILFITINGSHLEAVKMEPKVVYNVDQGGWHDFVVTCYGAFQIVENQDTHLHDTEIRPITAKELEELDEQLMVVGFTG